MTPDLAQHLSWFESWKQSLSHAQFRDRPIAYFCAEYALENGIPTYAGGLGVLAGDVVREAADRGIPMVAVGLYYRQNSVSPIRAADAGMDVDVYPEQVGLEPVMLAPDKPLRLQVPIQDRLVDVQAWKWKRNGVDVYLLDTNLETNSAPDRLITQRLYVDDRETRFKQEIVLGIGGLRLLAALNIHPSVYHLNEGHSALLGLELIRHQMEERSLGFDEAVQFARRRIVLTNHTLVSAGNEVYTDDLVSLLLERYAQEIAVPAQQLVGLGLVRDTSVFSMTMLALRLTSVVNAVSRLHARKAREIWRDHPMVAVTNGVHIPTWDRVGDDVSAPGAFWAKHQERKRELLAHVKETTGRNWDEGTLLLGWARRFVAYKRPLAVLEDLKRFAEIARNASRPVRVLYSGRPHASDAEGNVFLEKLRALADGELKDVVAYLPGYNLETAALMASGCDVWLNTPVVGFEACGTSGMKAALNGVLPCSTKDGWVDEAELYQVGWLLDDHHLSKDVLDRLETDIAPLYYDRDTAGVPEHWEQLMHNARAMTKNQFSATRMLRGYIETLYL